MALIRFGIHCPCQRALWASIGVLFLAAGTAVAQQKEQAVSPASRSRIDLTIYNGNLALVQDHRNVRLKKGINRLALSGVSPSMQPATATVTAHAKQPVTLIEQVFAFDLLTPETLLKHSIGRMVRIIKTHPTSGKESPVPAKVLSTRNGVVLKIGNQIETGIPGRIAFDSLPATLRERPTLLATLRSSAKIKARLDIRYLTGGLNWQADYVAELNPDDSTLAIQGIATITNNSGAAYEKANLRLVAGQVNRRRIAARPNVRALPTKQVAPAATGVTPQAAQDMHLYPIERKTSIGDRETKQITLFRAAAVPVTKEYRILGDRTFYTRRYGNALVVNAETFLKFKNDKASGLGLPMPAGVVRVYAPARRAATVFLGADDLRHTAKGEEIELRLGRAFDITATRRQKSFRKQGLPKNAYEAVQEIAVRNATPRTVTVILVERIPGDWKILSASAKHDKPASDRAEWRITLPPQGVKTLTYKTRVQL